MAETWVINASPALSNVTASIEFASAGSTYSTFIINASSTGIYEVGIAYRYGAGRDDYIMAFTTGGWTNQNYRTVTFDDPLDLTTPIGQWFSTNAEKQVQNITLDLSTIGLPGGTHSIRMRLSDDGATKADSDLSNAVTYYQLHEYSITTTLNHVTAGAGNPSVIIEGGTATLTFTADGTSKALPIAKPTVVGATGTWTKTSNTQGTLVLSNPTGNVSVTITGVDIYTVNGTGTNVNINGSSSYSGTITADGTLSVTLAKVSGYAVPISNPTVTGATGTYTRSTDSTATLRLTNPTGNVTFSAEGVVAYNITVTTTHCTPVWTNPTIIAEGGTAQLKFTFEGTSYVCPDIGPTVTGATVDSWIKVDNKNGTLNISNPTAPVSFTVEGKIGPPTCTIAGLGSSSPSSVTFTKSAGWSDTYETVTMPSDVAGRVDTFKKFPTMWRKINASSDGQITSVTISTEQIDDSYHVYPCFLAEDGVTILPYVLVGVSYSNSSSSCNSIAGYTDSAVQYLPSGRTNARARGTGYQMMDWMIHKLWQDLLICAIETVKTNPGGFTTDALGIYWGNKYSFIDGVTVNDSSKSFLFSYKPSKYVDSPTTSSDGYVQTSYTYSGTSLQEIRKLGYDSNNEFFNYPVLTTGNSSYDTYYCASFTFEASERNPVRCGPGYSVSGYGKYHGVFEVNAASSGYNAGSVRLCYRPIAST